MCGGHPYDPVGATSHEWRSVWLTRVLECNTCLSRITCGRAESQRAHLLSRRDRRPADHPYAHYRIDVFRAAVMAQIIRIDGEKLGECALGR